MAVLKSKDNKHMLIDFQCGCDEGLKFVITNDYDNYCFMTYTSGNFYKEQGETLWKVFKLKIRKIWNIISNKDFYYSEIVMTKDDFEEFKEYVNSI